MTEKDGRERNLRQRDEDSKRVHREASRDRSRRRDPAREAIAEWCRGNKWAEENARAVGNWPSDR